SAAVLGLYGLAMVLLLILIHLACLRSYGVPYIAPYAYYKWSDLKDAFLKAPTRSFRRRPSYLHPPDPVRMRERRGRRDAKRNEPDAKRNEPDAKRNEPGAKRNEPGAGRGDDSGGQVSSVSLRRRERENDKLPPQALAIIVWTALAHLNFLTGPRDVTLVAGRDAWL